MCLLNLFTVGGHEIFTDSLTALKFILECRLTVEQIKAARDRLMPLEKENAT